MKQTIVMLAIIAFIVVGCGSRDTNTITDNQANVTIDNSAYENVESIYVFEECHPSEFGNDWLPRYWDNLSGSYTLRPNYEKNIVTFGYEGHKYQPVVGEDSSLNVYENFSIDKFSEIKDLIFENQIEQYQLSFDVNGKVENKTEKYLIVINYTLGGPRSIGIKVPDNIEEIIAAMDQLIVSGAKNPNYVNIGY